jgi:hypothetical protein
MNAFPKINMSDTTRLTREGRLQEVMALLQGKHPTVQPSAAPTSSGMNMPVPAHRATALLSLLPSLPIDAHSGTAAQQSASGPGATNRARTQALHDILARIGQPGFTAGLEGLAGRASPRVQTRLPPGSAVRGPYFRQ